MRNKGFVFWWYLFWGIVAQVGALLFAWNDMMIVALWTLMLGWVMLYLTHMESLKHEK